MVTVVVCDDDAFLRQNVSQLCEDAGLTVVAETDSGNDAVELVRRFGVDVLLLDLALPDGSGERALEALRDTDPHPVVIVLTAYAEDPDRLARLGAREVIEKPDFSRLESVLAQLATAARTADPSAAMEERRRTTRAVVAPLELWRSPSGISSSNDLALTLRSTVPGDALLLIVTQGLDRIERDAGPTLAADCRLRGAALLRETLRVQDVIHEVPGVNGFVGVLRGGDATAAEAAWRRLIAAVVAAGVPGHLCGAHARIDERGGPAALARAMGVVTGAAPDDHLLLGA